MKVLARKDFNAGNAKVKFFRVQPESLEITISDILNSILNLSWLNKLENPVLQKSFRVRALPTVEYLTKALQGSLEKQDITEVGETVVSVLGRDTLIHELGYLDIPLAELIGRKREGNPGFDFHSENIDSHILIFGEAKYQCGKNAYGSALSQIVRFVGLEKDIADLALIEHLCDEEAQNNTLEGQKGYAAAFSMVNMETERIVNHIRKNADFNVLSQYDEILLIAVDLHE